MYSTSFNRNRGAFASKLVEQLLCDCLFIVSVLSARSNIVLNRFKMSIRICLDLLVLVLPCSTASILNVRAETLIEGCLDNDEAKGLLLLTWIFAYCMSTSTSARIYFSLAGALKRSGIVNPMMFGCTALSAHFIGNGTKSSSSVLFRGDYC